MGDEVARASAGLDSDSDHEELCVGVFVGAASHVTTFVLSHLLFLLILVGGLGIRVDKGKLYQVETSLDDTSSFRPGWPGPAG